LIVTLPPQPLRSGAAYFQVHRAGGIMMDNFIDIGIREP